MTGAETCELVLALDAIGDRERALQAPAPTCSTCARTTGPTGPATSSPTAVNWPAEQTTYTAAAVILAVDALAHTTAGADIIRGTTLPPPFAEIGLECGCLDSAHDVAGVS